MAVKKIKRVTICGFGLIGGSLALDLQKGRSRPEIIAYDRPSVLKRLKSKSHFKVKVESRFDKAVVGSDLIILSAYHQANQTMLERLAGLPLRNCLIIDTGAVKRQITALAKILCFDKSVQFLGTHPMSGKERNGFENAVESICRYHAWYVDEDVKLTASNKIALNWLFLKTGAFPVYIRSVLHDEIVSEISHLPQLISTILAAQINPAIIELAGPGLRSMLRLSGSPYSVWEEIIGENRDMVIDALQLYSENINTVMELIKKKKPLKEIFTSANRSYKCLS